MAKKNSLKFFLSQYIKSLIQNNWLWLLLLVSLIPLGDLFHPGLFVGHDTQDHVARIANFYQNLIEGNFIPRWAANLNWGYGHPILMFLYPLPSYVASFFHFLGFSLVDSVKIVFGLGFTLSAVAMYFWIRQLWGEKAGFVAGLLYLFAPYRFVDLYVRGAIGENFFFIWPPAVLFFLTKLAKKQKWQYIGGGAFSLAAMLLAHNALSLMFLPFIFLYGLLLILKSRRKLPITIYQLLIIILGFSLSAFFWLPAFFEGKYTLRDIVTKGEIFNRFESFSRLIYSPWSYGGTGEFSVQVGILQWLLIFLVPMLLFYLYKRKKLSITNYQLLITAFSFVFFWLAIFFILSYSQFIYQKLTILQKFQFPWRWLSLAIFPPAVFGGLLVYLTPKKLRIILAFSFLILSLYLNKDYWHAKAYSYKEESFYKGVYPGTTDTGESAPVWSVRFMLKKPAAYLEVVEGEAKLATVLRKTSKHIYKAKVKSEKARLLENTLYFPGWFVYVDGVRKSLYDIWFQDPNYRGLINFFVSKGEHLIEIKFEETKLRKAADIISLGSLVVLLGVNSTTILHSVVVKRKNAKKKR